ncbi:PREDICTED: protein MOS2 [Tarenaya hassleriana]|uniref:protein MOS2 n=1 Tax=Tarenaya hassleriana TaxID=28532 RepID=UPI00053CA5E5|nr:PREDICTED: protein MOS2 [Tarenaya hassleriana]
MKLSFSIPSKSSSKSKATPILNDKEATDDGNRKEFLTEFDPSKTLAESKPKYVIPPKENEWRPYKKMKNLDLPLQSSTPGSLLEFEVETLSNDAQGSDKISFGLNVRQNSKNDPVSNGEAGEEKKSEPVEQVLLKSLREDLDRLPDDMAFEDYEDVPVEGFGAALLAGYGWKPGQGIGKNAKEDVKVKEYKKWANREGLGFDPKISKARETKAEVKEGNGKSDERRESNGVDGFSVGKEVRIIAGREIGLKGKIVEKLGLDSVVLKLSGGEEEVKAGIDEIAVLGTKEEERCLKKLKDLRIREENQSSHKEKDRKSSKRSRDTERGHRNEVEVVVKDDREPTRDRKQKISWLRSHIRVRVISKNLKGGRFYLKKGKVVDVVGPMTCDIAMDETRELVQGVDQELLETALPRRGGPVLVLFGRHKGVYGSLVEKDLDTETGVVRDADSHEMLDVKLEQIAEFMGDPSDIGY